jgi:hypothetical protein
MTEETARAALIAVCLLGCVAALVGTGDDAARTALGGALAVLVPALVDSTRVAVRRRRSRRERQPGGGAEPPQ